jgi:hypothetical protein
MRMSRKNSRQRPLATLHDIRSVGADDHAPINNGGTGIGWFGFSLDLHQTEIATALFSGRPVRVIAGNLYLALPNRRRPLYFTGGTEIRVCAQPRDVDPRGIGGFEDSRPLGAFNTLPVDKKFQHYTAPHHE